MTELQKAVELLEYLLGKPADMLDDKDTQVLKEVKNLVEESSDFYDRQYES